MCLLLSLAWVFPWVLLVLRMASLPQYVNQFSFLTWFRALQGREILFIRGPPIPGVHILLSRTYITSSSLPAAWHLGASTPTPLWRTETAVVVLHNKPGGWLHSLKWVKTRVGVVFDCDSFPKDGFCKHFLRVELETNGRPCSHQDLKYQHMD